MRDRNSRPGRGRRVLGGLAAFGLLGASAYLTVELKEDATAGPALPAVSGGGEANPASARGERVYERLATPDRTVVRGSDGSVLATLTDGARTAVLAGPSRTFTEERFTSAKVVTDSWVRLMPQEWKEGAEKEQWFTEWFDEYLGSREPDLLAYAVQYIDGADRKADENGVSFAGDAEFGPLNPVADGDLRLEQSDFYDYLGMAYTFRDGTTIQPERKRYRAVDCSGYMRLVLGYRGRYPLAPTNDSGDGLPRTADAMARSRLGVPVLELTGERPHSLGKLQPGDLVFFEIDPRSGDRLDHVGIYMGLDAEGDPRFISSREEANGPTFGDKGGNARLDGNGFYAKGLRSAKRL